MSFRRMTTWIATLALVALASCGLADTAAEQQREPTRQWVVASWRGQDLAVLLQHPLFSYRQPYVVPLQNGVESWLYTTCWSDRADGWVQVNQQMALADPGDLQNCCYSQFFVAPIPGGRKQILEYRPNGCNSDCTAAATGCGGAQPRRGQL
jgi:hypothetical protein